MLSKRILPHKPLWWHDPELPRAKKLPSRSVRSQPVDPDRMNSVFTHGLDFKPSRHWKRYTELSSKDGGYIVELYSLHEVAKHYGLSQKTRTYWRRFILPQPFQLSSVNSKRAFFWSRIQLVVIDTVLKHLESKGIMTIRRDYTSCLDLVDHGCSFLEDHYSRQYEEQTLSDFDKFGVRKLDY